MKFFYIGLIFAALALNLVKADLKEDIEKLNKVCMQEAKSTPEEVAKFFGNGMKPEDATDAIKCHLLCMMEKNGHMKDGVLDDQHVMKKIEGVPALKKHRDDIAKAVAGCKSQKGVNNCDTAYKIMMCFNETEAGKLALSAY